MAVRPWGKSATDAARDAGHASVELRRGKCR
jgi:hypothetical protein